MLCAVNGPSREAASSALFERNDRDVSIDRSGGRHGELTRHLARHVTEELVPRQESALVGHQVVNVHRASMRTEHACRAADGFNGRRVRQGLALPPPSTKQKLLAKGVWRI